MVSQTKTKYSTCVVQKKVITKSGEEKLRTVCYLSTKDEEAGLDISYDSRGYIVSAL